MQQLKSFQHKHLSNLSKQHTFNLFLCGKKRTHWVTARKKLEKIIVKITLDSRNSTTLLNKLLAQVSNYTEYSGTSSKIPLMAYVQALVQVLLRTTILSENTFTHTTLYNCFVKIRAISTLCALCQAKRYAVPASTAILPFAQQILAIISIWNLHP